MSVEAFELVKYFPLIKVDEINHTAYGIATCEKEDKDGEICDYAGAKKAYQEWSKEAQESTTASGQAVSLGNIRYMHKLIIAGKATKLKFDDDRKQIWLESTPAPPMSKEDPDIWPLLRDGFLRGYSQGGKYTSRVCNTCRKDIQGNYCGHCDKRVLVRYVPTIAEVSWVDNPCLKEATFTLVKSDGSTELKKFGKKETLMTTDLNELIKAADCKCSCDKCKAGKCASCTADQKCGKADEDDNEDDKKKKEEEKAAEENEKKRKSADERDSDKEADKAIVFLVSKDGKKHLPVSNADGKLNHRMMGAAWAALHEGYRGQKYQGPDKQKAIKRLKQLYAREGKDTPSEKADMLNEVLKNALETTIQERAFGQFGKGLYTVGRFAEIVEALKYLYMSLDYERDEEGDESPATDELQEIFEQVLGAFLSYTEEQVEEEREKHHEKLTA
jgi:hypothetical protein